MFNKLFTSQPRSYEDPVINAGLDEIELNKWIISDFVTEVLYPITKNRPFPLDEQMLMVETVCCFRPKYIFDWGTHVGKSARIFWETCQAFNVHTEVHSIDLPDDEDHVEHPGETRGMLVKDCAGVTLHQGDGVSTALEIRKAKASKDDVCLFYVDGDHSYDSVKRELGMILKADKNPLVLLHDTFYQSKDSGYNVGPNQAINELLKNYPKLKRVDTQLGLPGMTLIYKP